jgi:hypothetical protein
MRSGGGGHRDRLGEYLGPAHAPLQAGSQRRGGGVTRAGGIADNALRRPSLPRPVPATASSPASPRETTTAPTPPARMRVAASSGAIPGA